MASPPQSVALGASLLSTLWVSGTYCVTIPALWGWFVVPVLRVPPIGMLDALGLLLAVRVLVGWRPRDLKGTLGAALERDAVRNITRGTVVLLALMLGFLVTLIRELFGAL